MQSLIGKKLNKYLFCISVIAHLNIQITGIDHTHNYIGQSKKRGNCDNSDFLSEF